jgi:indole-3-glycerol phosphate synthase
MTILEEIVAHKRIELSSARLRVPEADLRARCADREPPRDFAGAVVGTSSADARQGGRVDGEARAAVPACPPEEVGSHRPLNVIAEIKRSSPSAGTIVTDFDPLRIARTYCEAGAAALSVLTDERYFGGSLSYLSAVREAVPLPVLRKDFTIEAYQLYEARAAGADAVLLIAEVLAAAGIQELLPVCRELGLSALVEVHSAENCAAVLETLGPPARGHYLLGINNRNLAIQQTDLATTEQLARTLPPGSPFISESGIHTAADADRVRAAGACAVLVGESLLKAADVGALLSSFRGR